MDLSSAAALLRFASRCFERRLLLPTSSHRTAQLQEQRSSWHSYTAHSSLYPSCSPLPSCSSSSHSAGLHSPRREYQGKTPTAIRASHHNSTQAISASHSKTSRTIRVSHYSVTSSLRHTTFRPACSLSSSSRSSQYAFHAFCSSSSAHHGKICFTHSKTSRAWHRTHYPVRKPS